MDIFAGNFLVKDNWNACRVNSNFKICVEFLLLVCLNVCVLECLYASMLHL